AVFEVHHVDESAKFGLIILDVLGALGLDFRLLIAAPARRTAARLAYDVTVAVGVARVVVGIATLLLSLKLGLKLNDELLQKSDHLLLVHGVSTISVGRGNYRLVRLISGRY